MSRESTLLIVDDAPEMVTYLEKILGGAGYRTIAACSGEEALMLLDSKTLSQQVIDLILLDVMMPGMDGFEVSTRIKQRPQFHDTPVIFVSAATSPYQHVEGAKVGAVDYINKPFIDAELLSTIERNVSYRQRIKRNQSLLDELCT